MILHITDQEQEDLTFAIICQMDQYRPGSDTYNRLSDLHEKI